MKNLYQSGFLILLFICKMTAIAQVPILNSYPSASAVVFFDFDGHTVTGTSWNVNGPFYCSSSGMSSIQITEMFNRVAEDYRPFNLNVTTDSTKFLAAPVTKRMRVIITISSAWYGSAGGVAFIGSFTWGDDTPCFVFSALLGYNVKNISEAISHECGHTLGLFHQSSYDANCVKISEYNYGQGSGETGWAPIMGVGYNKNFTIWHNGPNPYGCATVQNDFTVIADKIGVNAIRPDDHGNNFGTATKVNFRRNQFSETGFIEINSDFDFFKFTVHSPDHLNINATPFNIGNNNEASNLDLEISLFNNAGQLIKTYNPQNLLSAVIDTNIVTGTYYLKVKGTGNSNVSNYGSLGGYSLEANLSDLAMPVHQLKLEERLVNGKHELNGIIGFDEEILDRQIQISSDGINFKETINIPGATSTFNYTPASASASYYRLKVLVSNGKNYYSNIVALNVLTQVLWPHLVTTIITNDCPVNSPGDFTFSIYSLSGQFISLGHLNKGFTQIKTTNLTKGIYLINFSSPQGSYTERFLKQ